MRKIYLDLPFGISGDMIVAALLDLGADEDNLMKVLDRIGDESFSVEISDVEKNGIICKDFNVILDKDHENHDHDMEYLYGHLEGGDLHDGDTHHHHHVHDHTDTHHHEHVHDHDHSHRNLSDVEKIINSLEMPEGARRLSLKTFRILAEAEAMAHGKDIDEVHFHEVGAIDSIVDIIAASVCFESLEITDVIIPRICEGTGTVRAQHGILPIPVPAVSNIASSYHLPLSVTNRKGELITPTGAAFAAAIMTEKKLPETFSVERIGLGAGKRKHEIPSMVRAMIISDEDVCEDFIWKIECNIDDSTGEELGYAMERLMEEGGRDVFYTPVFMKKNRPSYLLTVITDDEHLDKMESIIFSATTTIGLRKMKMERTVLERKEDMADTKYGRLKVKKVRYKDMEKTYPEYESARLLAKENDISLRDVYKEL